MLAILRQIFGNINMFKTKIEIARKVALENPTVTAFLVNNYEL
jgi:hypothetical protein